MRAQPNDCISPSHQRNGRAFTSTSDVSHADHERWVYNLPIVLLGIRTSFKPDVNACAAELVYGSTLSLPGEFLEQKTLPAPGDVNDLLHRLRQFVRSKQSQPPRVSNASFFLDPRLKTCSHVFLRCDRIRRLLQPPYDGPCQVLSRGDKTFKILPNGREWTQSSGNRSFPISDFHSTRYFTSCFILFSRPDSIQLSCSRIT